MAKWRLYDVIRQKRDMIWKKIIFSKCIFDHFEQLLIWCTSLKNQFIVPKIETLVKNYWETAKWLIFMTSDIKNGTWYGKFFLQNVSQIMLSKFPWSKFNKNNAKGLQMAKRCQKVAFSIFPVSTLMYPPQPQFASAKQYFSEPPNPSADY